MTADSMGEANADYRLWRDRLDVILRKIAEGLIGPRQARRELRQILAHIEAYDSGVDDAWVIASGTWAHYGGYRTGEQGMRECARDALRYGRAVQPGGQA